MSTEDHSPRQVDATVEDEALSAAAAELTPEKSLVRVEETARFVFANVAVVGTVLAGVGLITDVGSAWDEGPKVVGVPLPVALVAAALILAAVALVPLLVRVDTTDLAAVRSFYTFQLLRRGVCAILAMIALAAAIASAVATTATHGGASQALAVSGSIAGTASGPAFSGSAAVGGLHDEDYLFLSVYVTTTRHRDMLICRKAASPMSKGVAKVTCPNTPVVGLTDVTVVASVYRRGKTIEARKLELRR